MKRTPLCLRLLGGALLIALLAASCALPPLTRGECAALIALGERGKPYVFGKEGPDSFDCSGLTKRACAPLGTELVHSAKYVAYDDQYETISDPARFIPGDLIFFDTVADRDACDHVGIWLGMNRFVHASSSAGRVMISSFDEKWRGCYSWGKRVLDPCALPALDSLFARG